MPAKIEKDQISQHKLRRYLELKKKADEFKEISEEIKGIVKEGNYVVQPGPLAPKLTKKKGQVRPSWKSQYEFLAEVHYPGKSMKMVQDVVSNTQPGDPSYTLEVIDTRTLMG